MAGGVDVAVQDVDDAVAGFLASVVRCEDCGDVGVVGEAVMVLVLGHNRLIEHGRLTVEHSTRRSA